MRMGGLGVIDQPYQSFLVCIHADRANIYHNGLPLGVLDSLDHLQIHNHTMPDGTKFPVKRPANLFHVIEEILRQMPDDEDWPTKPVKP